MYYIYIPLKLVHNTLSSMLILGYYYIFYRMEVLEMLSEFTMLCSLIIIILWWRNGEGRRLSIEIASLFVPSPLTKLNCIALSSSKGNNNVFFYALSSTAYTTYTHMQTFKLKGAYNSSRSNNRKCKCNKERKRIRCKQK